MLPENHEDYPGDSRKPPLRREKERTDHEEEEDRVKVLVQQNRAPVECQTYRELLQESVQGD